jgi:hypothetical protein
MDQIHLSPLVDQIQLALGHISNNRFYSAVYTFYTRWGGGRCGKNHHIIISRIGLEKVEPHSAESGADQVKSQIGEKERLGLYISFFIGLWGTRDQLSTTPFPDTSCGAKWTTHLYHSSPGFYKGQAMGGEKGRKGMLSYLIVLNIMKQPFLKF